MDLFELRSEISIPVLCLRNLCSRDNFRSSGCYQACDDSAYDRPDDDSDNRVQFKHTRSNETFERKVREDRIKWPNEGCADGVNQIYESVGLVRTRKPEEETNE